MGDVGLVPVPDYIYYQDQAEEIDDLTKRIGALTDSLKLVGFYPVAAEAEISSDIEKALNPNTGNQLIPVPGWATGAASKPITFHVDPLGGIADPFNEEITGTLVRRRLVVPM